MRSNKYMHLIYFLTSFLCKLSQLLYNLVHNRHYNPIVWLAFWSEYLGAHVASHYHCNYQTEQTVNKFLCWDLIPLPTYMLGNILAILL